MSLFYEAIGRLVVEFVRRRYRRELQAAAAVGVGLAALGAAAYLAGRDSDDDEA